MAFGGPIHIRNKNAQAALNGTTLVTAFTHGTSLVDPTGDASGGGGVLDRLVISNPDTVQHTYKIYRVPSGGSASDATNLIKTTPPIPAGQDYTLEGPYYSKDGDFYQVKYEATKTTTESNAQAHYHEMASA